MKVEFDNALNEAGLVLLHELRKYGDVNGRMFNNIKPSLKIAIESYLAEKCKCQSIPQPKEVEWVNGDECEIDMTEGVRRYIFGCECPNNQNTCIVFTKDGSGHMVMPIERLKKPESPEEKIERERLEAAKLLPDVDIESWFWEIDSVDRSNEYRLNTKGKLATLLQSYKLKVIDAGYAKKGGE